MINYIDIAIIIIFIMFIVSNYKKGITMSLLGLLRYAVGIPLCFYVSDTYSLNVYNSFVRPNALEVITNEIAKGSSTADGVRKSVEDMLSNFPSFLVQNIDVSNLKIDTKNVAETVLTNVFEQPLIAITKGIIFVLTFVAFFLLTRIIMALISKHRKNREQKNGKSLLSKTDRFFGALFGALKAIIVVLAIVSIIEYANGLNDGASNQFFEMVDSSHLLPLINKFNPLNQLIGG